MRKTIVVFFIALFACVVAARQAKEGIPEGWKMRLDQPESKQELKFWTMPPGWHITSGPSCILYNAALKAEGNFRVQSESFLFPPGQRLEGFGVFIGGQDLEAPSQSYTYFLLRRDGRFLVKQRNGSQTSEMVAWTEHPAIVKHDGGEGTAKNLIAIEAGAENVDFFVNGQKVTTLPRSKVRADGIIGLRVNHGLNIHVTNLEVTRK